MDMKEVFPTTGAISVGGDGTYIVLEQERFGGGEKHVIRIPQSLFLPLLDALFTQMSMSDFDELAALCRMHKEMQLHDIQELVETANRPKDSSQI